MGKAKYIVLEGVDGAGKTTQAKLLEKHLKNQGYKVYRFHEPSTKIKSIINQYLSNNKKILSPTTFALLFAADRALHKDEVLKQAFEKYDYIIGDRSFYSSVCYQELMGLERDWVVCLNKSAIVPDLVIILNIDIEEYIKRKGNTDILFEKIEFQKALIKKYKELKKIFPSHPIHYINGKQSKEKIHQQIINLLDNLH